jgi:hypothetical protein
LKLYIKIFNQAHSFPYFDRLFGCFTAHQIPSRNLSNRKGARQKIITSGASINPSGLEANPPGLNQVYETGTPINLAVKRGE